MPRTRLPYTPEFRAEAVQLYRSSGRGLKQISTELGIAPESLRRWAQQLDVDAGRAPGLTTEEREELRRLRRENRTLRMERDLLKKATAFFAREGETP
jgi:transposase